MWLGRNLHSRLDLLKPKLEQKVAEKQRRQQFDHNKHSRMCQFSDGEKVFVKNQGRGETWLPGHIIESTGPVSFKVQLQDGRTISRHQDHLRKWFSSLWGWYGHAISAIVEQLLLPVLHPQNRKEHQLCRRHCQLLNRTVKLLHHYLSPLWLVVIPLEWESHQRDIELHVLFLL